MKVKIRTLAKTARMRHPKVTGYLKHAPLAKVKTRTLRKKREECGTRPCPS